MPFTTPTQFAVLLLMLGAGWLFGFASHSGGRKWRRAYDEERAGRARERTELEARNAELSRELETARAAAVPVAASAAKPAKKAGAAKLAPRKRGWFEWGDGEDLTRLRGVDAELAGRFRTEKVASFADMAALTDADEIALERRIDLPAGYIRREQLREQAKLLAAGDTAGHAKRFN